MQTDQNCSASQKFLNDWGWLLRVVSPLTVIIGVFLAGGIWWDFSNMKTEFGKLQTTVEAENTAVHRLETNLARIEGLLQRDSANGHAAPSPLP